jgi:hypothetical protein
VPQLIPSPLAQQEAAQSFALIYRVSHKKVILQISQNLRIHFGEEFGGVSGKKKSNKKPGIAPGSVSTLKSP